MDRVECIKDCILENITDKKNKFYVGKCFTDGKEYDLIDDFGGDYYAIIDDTGVQHNVGLPSEKFFDKHFKIINEWED